MTWETFSAAIIVYVPPLLLVGAAILMMLTAWTTENIDRTSRLVASFCAMLIGLISLVSFVAAPPTRWAIVVSLLPSILITQHGVIQSAARRPLSPRPAAVRDENLRGAAARVRRTSEKLFSPAALGSSYGVPALLCAVLVSAAINFLMDVHEPFSASPRLTTAAAWGLAGAYVTVVLRLGQRAVTRDMTNGVVVWSVVSLALGPIVGAIAGLLTEAPPPPADPAQAFRPLEHIDVKLAVIYFVAGAAPRWFVGVMTTVAQRLSAPSTVAQAASRVIPLNRIRGVTSDIEERLAEEGISDVNALAMSDPVRLFRNTTFGKRVILDWIDEALLLVVLPEAWQALERLGITGAVDLAWLVKEDRDPTLFSTLAREARIDEQVLRAVARRLEQDVQVQLVWFLYQYEEDLIEARDEEPAVAA